jgi:hypothetical protein
MDSSSWVPPEKTPHIYPQTSQTPAAKAMRTNKGIKRALTNTGRQQCYGESRSRFLQVEELSLLMATKIPSGGLGGSQVSPSG